MTDHLPECPTMDWPPYIYENDRPICICDRLRACEKRVNDEWVRDYGGHRAFALGVQAAREAVAAMPPMEGWKTRPVGRVDLVDKWSALAAIDGLRGES